MRERNGNWWCSTQNSDTNMWNMNNGSPNNNNKTNNNTVLPVYAYHRVHNRWLRFFMFSMDDNFVTWPDMELAYRDFLRHKRSTTSAYEYMQEADHDVPLLMSQLNDGTYTISYSVAFCVTRPKLREVFAAAPRDRIVHHLLICKFGEMFESLSIGESFNCRRLKGNSAMTRYVHDALTAVGREGWVCKTDIKGCFMSIDKDILWSMLEPEIRRWCEYDAELRPHVERWVWLWRMIVYHRPEEKCVVHGDVSLFDRLPADKTLFRSGGKGLAIGNLTSQILANFYFSRVDREVSGYMAGHGGYYARYMDDVFLCAVDRGVVLQGARMFSMGISHLNLRLHPNKFYLQHADRSLSMIGQTHVSGRVYAGRRTVFNAMRTIRRFNYLASRGGDEWVRSHIMHISSSINSYFGFMRYSLTYAIRYRMWNAIGHPVRRYLYSSRMRKVTVISSRNPRMAHLRRLRHRQIVYNRFHRRRRRHISRHDNKRDIRQAEGDGRR